MDVRGGIWAAQLNRYHTMSKRCTPSQYVGIAGMLRNTVPEQYSDTSIGLGEVSAVPAVPIIRDVET